MTNVRAGTVAQSRPFAAAAADGFYQRQNIAASKTAKARKQPYFISPDDGQVMALAGCTSSGATPTVEDDNAPGRGG
ncbi:SOS response-associated peptidase family protein [Streptomyces kronopolitis]